MSWWVTCYLGDIVTDDPKARVLAAALRCFAAKGYAATTIIDIEKSAGLTAGAGGTYRHFRSKKAILEGVVDAVVEQGDDVLAPPPASLKDAARTALADLDRQRDLLQLLRRDLDQFPEIQHRIIDRLISGPVRLVADRTAALAPHVDAEAVATLLLGALINAHQIEALMGDRPGVIDRERLVAAWADLYRGVIAPPLIKDKPPSSTRRKTKGSK